MSRTGDPLHRPTRPGPAATALACAAAASLAASVAAQPLDDFRASYRLTSDGSEIGHLRQELQTGADGIRRFTSVLDPAGLLITLVSGTITEHSELERSDGRLRPLVYRYSRTGLGRNRDVAIVFDWTARQARNVVNGDAWAMAITAETLDKHGLVLNVAEDLAAGTLRARYPVADGGRLKEYQHDDLGTQTISTPNGTFATRQLRRLRTGKTEGTDFWHAPARAHLPVAVERIDGDGRRLRLELIDFEQPPRPAGAEAR
jgi:hypothetical protein